MCNQIVNASTPYKRYNCSARLSAQRFCRILAPLSSHHTCHHRKGQCCSAPKTHLLQQVPLTMSQRWHGHCQKQERSLCQPKLLGMRRAATSRHRKPSDLLLPRVRQTGRTRQAHKKHVRLSALQNQMGMDNDCSGMERALSLKWT